LLLVSETIRAIASFECVSPQEPDPSSNSPLELLGKLDKRYAKYATDFTQFENIQVPLVRSPVSYLLRTLGKPKLLCHIILTQIAPHTVWLHGRHLVGERVHGPELKNNGTECHATHRVIELDARAGISHLTREFHVVAAPESTSTCLR
jgi:hypothetical protein